MRIALIDGQRHEPSQSGLRAICQGCGHPVVAKCGNIRVHHWAHMPGEVCPYEREPETEWHKNWKSHFPLGWQERRFKSEAGEVHIADVYSPEGKGMAVEFQHSPITPIERTSRERQYRRLLWVVDGTRRSNDLLSFERELRFSEPSPDNALKRFLPGRCALLRDWKDSTVPVFFDFGDSLIWGLIPMRTHGRLVVGLTSRDRLVVAIRRGEFPKSLRSVKKPRPPLRPSYARRPRRSRF